MNELFEDMKRKGLVSTEDWLDRAIHQHNPKVTIMLARTEPIRIKPLDFLDSAIMYREGNN